MQSRLSNDRRVHPPIGMRRPQGARGLHGALPIRKQSKAGRARARHAREAQATLSTQSRQHIGNHGRNSNRRFLEIIACLSERRDDIAAHRRMRRLIMRVTGLQTECAKHIDCRNRDTRIDEHGIKRRKIEHRALRLADAAHHACLRGDADGHIGTKHSGVTVRCALAGHQTQRRRSIGRAAANARCDGQIFNKTK